jgi:hypothetical protein
MRFGVAGWSLLVVVVACGGSNDETSDGGGAGGTGAGGAGGGGGAKLCDQNCGKLGFAECPVPYDVAGCEQNCTETYAQLPECSAELDAVAQCLIVKAVATCDADGQATYPDKEALCPAQYDALDACASPDGG